MRIRQLGVGHARYVVLTGDADYLIYAEAVSSQPLDPTALGSGDEIYALARTGPPIHIGKALAEPQLVSLSQSNLVIVNPFKHHERVRSWNLTTGHHGDIGSNEDVVGATPNGWLAKDGGFTDGTHVVARSYSGHLVDYGNPVTPGVDFAITVGPNGFVAYADNFRNDDGEITYTPWSRPIRHRMLLAPGGKDVRCASVSASHAGCLMGSGASTFATLIALSGKSRTTGSGRCAYALAVWGSELAWSINTGRHDCAKQHIGLLTDAGTTRYSTKRFDPLGATTAWGRLVTSQIGQRALVTLTGIRSTPKPLVRATVS